MEQSALEQADLRLSQAKVLTKQTRKISPDTTHAKIRDTYCVRLSLFFMVTPITNLPFVFRTSSFWNDVFFDNAMSDINRHRTYHWSCFEGILL